MKTKLLFGLGALLIVGLASCNINPSQTSNKLANESQADALAYQATTSLLTFNNIKAPSTKLMAKRNAISAEEKQKIEDLLPTINVLLENDDNFVVENQASTREGYEFNQKISFRNLLSETQSYELFYNITKEKNEREFDDEDGEEIEIEKHITGIAIMGEQELSFKGKIEVETEDDEHEEELEFILETGTNSFIKVKQEKELENGVISEEYKYTIVENKVVVHSFSFERDSSDTKNKTEIKATIMNTRYKFDIYEDNNETFIRAKIKDDANANHILYKKVVETLESGESVVSFQEVIK